MSDYGKLVKELRETATFTKLNDLLSKREQKLENLAFDAAAAIEALQKRLVNALTALHLANEKMGYYGIQPYTEADGEDMISDWVKTLVHEELKQQLPKRGEWEREMDVNDEPFYQCSVCGECFDFNSDSTHEVFNYCPNCGADMRKMEVQE